MKIFIIEDHKIVRDGLKLILQSDPRFEVVGESDKVPNTIDDIKSKLPNICLLDINLGTESGLPLLEQIIKECPEVKVAILSMHTSPEYITRSFKLGASAYFPKDISPQILLQGLHALENEKIHYLPGQKELLKSQTKVHVELPEREKEVIKLIAKGYSSKQMADMLKLSPRTIESHRFNIMKKLEVSNSVEAVSKAIEAGIVIV